MEESLDRQDLGGLRIGGGELERGADRGCHPGGPGPILAASVEDGDLEVGEGGLEGVGEVVWMLRGFSQPR